MATIREKGPYQWHAQVRRQGWPSKTATFRSKKQALAWARKTEVELDQGLFVNAAPGWRTTLGELIDLYLRHVTVNRPSAHSRIAEEHRLNRFKREERVLCAYAVANLTPELFEDYWDRRLRQTVGRAKGKPKKTIAPGTVKRELTLLKRVIDYRKRHLGLLVNPVNTEDAKRPLGKDERDVRLSS